MRYPVRLGRNVRKIELPTITSLATIVVPSKYPDIFENCRASLEQFAPKAPKILVRDGRDIVDPAGWTTIQGPAEPFVYARNVNLGIKACSGDVLLMNDDVQFIFPRTLEILQGVLATQPEIGILSPVFDGWSTHAICSEGKIIQVAEEWVSFACVLIKRDVINKAGLLDERFTGYGFDDIDFCHRALLAGHRSATTSMARVHHGFRGTIRNTSYSKLDVQGLMEKSHKMYNEKWGVDYKL